MAFKRFAVSINARNEHQDWRDYLPHAYIDYLQVLGIWPVLIPTALAYPDAYLAALGVEGLILTGGGDVDPARSGSCPAATRSSLRYSGGWLNGIYP
jgi:gamma-glutamyl-gamma-aminobutyrate hydrolase PuuD